MGRIKIGTTWHEGQIAANIAKNLAIIHDNLVPAPVPKITEEQVEHYASKGFSKQNICSLFRKDEHLISKDENLLAAFNRGRAIVGNKIREQLIVDALENGSMPAKLYLDKVMGGDVDVRKVEMSVIDNKLKEVSTEELLNVSFTIKNEDDSSNT